MEEYIIERLEELENKGCCIKGYSEDKPLPIVGKGGVLYFNKSTGQTAVWVNGTYVYGGSSGGSIYGEEYTTSGNTYTLNNAPNNGTLRVYRNGIRLSSSDYSNIGADVTLTDSDTNAVYINDYNI